MKKSVLILVLLLMAAPLFAAGKNKVPSTVWVSVENASLKEKPGRFGKDVTEVSYGDKLEVTSANGDWYKVSTLYGETGWIPRSSVGTKKIVVGHQADADAKEISLAGKGFTQEVEDVYKQEHDLDFTRVDDMERLTVTDEELQQFLADGKLEQGE